jgi:predicted enzyme related to lactoylglutathione lyase
MEVKVENALPVLSVSDFAASLRFYTDILGFQVDWGGEPGSRIGGISRDAGHLMLTQAGPPYASQVWIGVEDIAPIFNHIMQTGVKIIQEPTNQPWAYEMRIADPDGNVLWFGSDSLDE